MKVFQTHQQGFASILITIAGLLVLFTSTIIVREINTNRRKSDKKNA